MLLRRVPAAQPPTHNTPRRKWIGRGFRTVLSPASSRIAHAAPSDHPPAAVRAPHSAPTAAPRSCASWARRGSRWRRVAPRPAARAGARESSHSHPASPSRQSIGLAQGRRGLRAGDGNPRRPGRRRPVHPSRHGCHLGARAAPPARRAAPRAGAAAARTARRTAAQRLPPRDRRRPPSRPRSAGRRRPRDDQPSPEATPRPPHPASESGVSGTRRPIGFTGGRLTKAQPSELAPPGGASSRVEERPMSCSSCRDPALSYEPEQMPVTGPGT